MSTKFSKTIIVKLGGSLVVPEDIDIRYLKNLSSLLKKYIKQGKKFIIIVGGGHTNRWYRDRAVALGVKNETDLHWIGIMSTRLNAELVRAVFGKLAHESVYFDNTKKLNWKRPILIAAGSKLGGSTDYEAVLIAEKLKAKTVINMTNVTGLYTKDPKKYRDAKPIKEISWKNYRKMFGNPKKHLPGQNIPIDAVAALASQKMKLETFYIGGRDIKNFDNLLSGKTWRGTRIY